MCIGCEPQLTEQEIMESERVRYMYCPLLAAIPLLPNMVTLICHSCPLLVTIPVLPKLKHLTLMDCPLLVTIPVIHQLEMLSIRQCSSLTSLPVLPSLRILACASSPSLETLPELPNLQTLICSGCPRLASLPVLPKLMTLDCDPWINHPLNEELPEVQKAARTLARRRLKKLRYVRFKKFISTPAHSAYLNSPGHVGHRIETAQLRKLGSERT